MRNLHSLAIMFLSCDLFFAIGLHPAPGTRWRGLERGLAPARPPYVRVLPVASVKTRSTVGVLGTESCGRELDGRAQLQPPVASSALSRRTPRWELDRQNWAISTPRKHTASSPTHSRVGCRLAPSAASACRSVTAISLPSRGRRTLKIGAFDHNGNLRVNRLRPRRTPIALPALPRDR